MSYAKNSLLFLFITSIAGCGSTTVEVIDLNKVLDVFQSTLTELDGDDKDSVEGAKVEVAATDKEKSEKFVTTFRKNLKTAKLISTPIGVQMHASGKVIGFGDKDDDNVKDTGERQLFGIDIDEERSRVIASDESGHHRDHHYRPHFGFFSGYLLGSMMGNRRSYFSGSRSHLKPNYSKTSMSPKTYHKSAVAKASSAARASSSRSRSGSRGFSFGK